MSFEYLNPLRKRSDIDGRRLLADRKAKQNLVILGWKPEDDTYLLDEKSRNLPKSQSKDEKNGKIENNHNNQDKDLKNLPQDSEYSVFTKPKKLMNKRDFRILRELNNIKISYLLQKTVEFNLIRDWEESGLIKEIQGNIENILRIKKPTAVQMQMIPVSLKFKDVICIAPTGSGKTLAFLLPLINFLYFMPRIRAEKAHEGPYAIVLGPTRELVLQLADVFEKSCAGLNIKSKVFLGGHDKLDNLFDPAEVIFATVGRYKDLLENNEACLNQCYYVIIDEADFMISLDLSESLDYILSNIFEVNNKSAIEWEAHEQEKKMEDFEALYRVTQMFSATMPEKLTKITEKYLKNPVHIQVEVNQEQLNNKQHFFEYLGEKTDECFGQKIKLLKMWLKKLELKIIVFFNTKIELDKCAKALKYEKFKIGSYHGGFDQVEREQTISKFRDGSFEVLLSTDLGGRGLDIEDIKSVVNFDAPKDFEQYTHRTGRTARAGKSGVCLSFFSKSDNHLFTDITKILESASQFVPDFLKPFQAKNISKGNYVILLE